MEETMPERRSDRMVTKLFQLRATRLALNQAVSDKMIDGVLSLFIDLGELQSDEQPGCIALPKKFFTGDAYLE